MNELSLLIYTAGVVNQVSNFFMLLMMLFAVAFVLLSFATMIAYVDSCERRISIDKTILSVLKKYLIFLITSIIITGIISNILPSRETVILIAASELNEKIINSPKLQGTSDPSSDLLTLWIQEQTIQIKKNIDKKMNKNE